MSWNIAPECVSIVFLCIIWMYSYKGNLIPSLKNKLFQASFLITFVGMSTNILSTLLLYSLQEKTFLLAWTVTQIYFATTPLMGMAYSFYVIANIYEESPKLGRYLLVSSIPGGLYLIAALLNPFTHVLFQITLQNGYVQGPHVTSTYTIFYFYCVACILLVALQGKCVAPKIRFILLIFPLISAVLIVVQQFFPSTILSGSAATGALLIIYLNLQNKQTSIDYLTQVFNRQELLKMMDLYLRRRFEFSILVISLREFKNINDTYGQHCGDLLLTTLSHYLRKELGLREDEIFRYGGDEFAILLQKGNDADLTTLLRRISARMALAWDVPGCTCILPCAIGVASYPDTATEMSGLINGLEYAVSRAKKETDQQKVCYCTPQLLEAFKRRHIIAEELEHNLQTRGFELHYQPIYSVERGEFVKAEALLRMPSTRLERVFPDEFIPIAEESGLIIEITYLVLDKVCRFIRQLMDQGVALDSINVNFSALQFTQKDLIARVVGILDHHHIPYSKIKIELTESSLAENVEGITAYLLQLNELGLRIGLDDFGTGYSNLISVLDLPISTVKLDKSLVWSAVKDQRCSIALQSFAHAFRDLGMTVLAEGVETEEQRQLVVAAGCTLIQGYFYARPMPEAAFTAFLMEHAPSKSEL